MYELDQIKNKLLCGDVIEELSKIPDKSIHCIITSPPYNVGKEYGVDDRREWSVYIDWVEKVLIELYRVLIAGGRIAINLPSSILQSATSRMAYLSLDYVLIMRKIGFLDREWITWIKQKGGGVVGKSTSWGSWRSPTCPYLRDASEMIIVMDKEQHKRTDRSGQNDITSQEFLNFSVNCWYMPPIYYRKHPASFPEELPYRIIKVYTFVGDIVLDPFIGSGTTGVVAKKLNRYFIGIDINSDYIKMAKRRISAIPESIFR